MRYNQPPSGISPFDSIRHLDEQGNEYWNGRDLAMVLGYSSWASFIRVLERAVQVASRSSFELTNPLEYIVEATKEGSAPDRAIQDQAVHLTRYGCYVVAMNADLSSEIATYALVYFAHYTPQTESSVGYSSTWSIEYEARQQH